MVDVKEAVKSAMNPTAERVYKVVKINGKDGTPVSMKIRPIPA